jgi:hypothetical protein
MMLSVASATTALAMTSILASAAAASATETIKTQAQGESVFYQEHAASLMTLFHLGAAVLVIRGLDKLFGSRFLQAIGRFLAMITPKDIRIVLLLKLYRWTWSIVNGTAKMLISITTGTETRLLASTWLISYKVCWHLLAMVQGEWLIATAAASSSMEFRFGVLSTIIAASLISSIVATSTTDAVRQCVYGHALRAPHSAAGRATLKLALLYIGLTCLTHRWAYLSLIQTTILMSLLVPAVADIATSVVGLLGNVRARVDQPKANPVAPAAPVQNGITGRDATQPLPFGQAAAAAVIAHVTVALETQVAVIAPVPMNEPPTMPPKQKRTRTPKVKGAAPTRFSERLRTKAAMQQLQ